MATHVIRMVLENGMSLVEWESPRVSVALAPARFVSSLLFGLGAADPSTPGGVLMLGLVAVIAGYLHGAGCLTSRSADSVTLRVVGRSTVALPNGQ